MSSLTITITSLSGGQGKTTVAFLLSLYLLKNGSVLAIDTDPQASLTMFLQFPLEPNSPTALELITGKAEPIDCLYQCDYRDRLCLIPADNALYESHEYLASSGMSFFLMRSRLESIKPAFDWIVIDSPPSRSQLTITTIGAADCLVIPAETHTKGVGSLLRTLELIESLQTVLGKQVPPVIGIVPFRDKWIGRTRQKESAEAIVAMQQIAREKHLFLLPPIVESERTKQALNKNKSLSEIGFSELEHWLEQLEVILWQKK